MQDIDIIKADLQNAHKHIQYLERDRRDIWVFLSALKVKVDQLHEKIRGIKK